jgi:hypothetical protein
MTKSNLQDKHIVFKLTISPSTVYSGIVRYVESDGLWIESGTLVGEMQHNSAWKSLVDKFQKPIVFVPVVNLSYLIAEDAPQPSGS